MKRVVYVGNKECKPDNIAGTGLVWTRGQIHEVEDDITADKLLFHTLVWKNADQPFELVKELEVVAPEPRVNIIPKETSTDLFWEPYVIPVSAEMFKMLREGKVKPVWMTVENAEKYKDMRFPEADGEAEEPQNILAEVVDTAPAETGPAPQPRDTKPGLDKPGLDSPKKRAAVAL